MSEETTFHTHDGNVGQTPAWRHNLSNLPAAPSGLGTQKVDSSPARRVLVCGGRDYHDAERMEAVLSDVLGYDDVVVHGGARGADALAGDIAGRVLGHKVEVYPADWHKHGKAAGPIRNQQMLDTGIDLVIAFPGGRGTDDMIRRSEKAGVEVHRV